MAQQRQQQLPLLVLALLIWALVLPGQTLAGTEKRQATTLTELPPGAAPAIVQALAKDLPAGYQPQAGPEGYTLANPSHDLKMTLTESGPSIQFGNQKWRMRLTGFGYEGDIQPVATSNLSRQGERLVYHHTGVEEWYINSRWGIEQGFTVPEPPQPANTDQKLILQLSLTGVEARLEDNTLLLTNFQGAAAALQRPRRL